MELKPRHPTRVYRNAYGDWAAEDSYRMSEGRVLTILTMKRYGGKVVTTAQVSRASSGGALMYDPFGDFSERMGEVKMRLTEANLRKQHSEVASPEKALAVLQRAVEYYNTVVKHDKPNLLG